MKTLKNYTGTDKNMFNDKYNFICVIWLTDTHSELMFASITYDGCLKSANSKWNKRIGFEKALRFTIENLS